MPGICSRPQGQHSEKTGTKEWLEFVRRKPDGSPSQHSVPSGILEETLREISVQVLGSFPLLAPCFYLFCKDLCWKGGMNPFSDIICNNYLLYSVIITILAGGKIVIKAEKCT